MMESFAKDAYLKKITSIIVKAVLPERIILFGSRAGGDSIAESDYDLIIIKKNILNERTVSTAVYKAFYENGLEVPVDVIAIDSEKWEKLKNDRNLIYHTARTEGVVLYG